MGFAERKGITFPLLNDHGSSVILDYGILNTGIHPDHRAYGVPFPGTFVLDHEGRVVERIFEESYRTRYTGRGLVEHLGLDPEEAGEGLRVSTDHLEVVLRATDDGLAVGQETVLTLEVTAGEGIHVYAPGEHDYRYMRLVLDPDGPFTLREPMVPEAETYHFEPLDETVPVYTGSFRIRQPVVLEVSRELAERAGEAGARVTLDATLEYQACDDRVCFLPEAVPVSLSFDLRPLEPR
jgi:hypothetical protein